MREISTDFGEVILFWDFFYPSSACDAVIGQMMCTFVILDFIRAFRASTGAEVLTLFIVTAILPAVLEPLSQNCLRWLLFPLPLKTFKNTHEIVTMSSLAEFSDCSKT